MKKHNFLIIIALLSPLLVYAPPKIRPHTTHLSEEDREALQKTHLSEEDREILLKTIAERLIHIHDSENNKQATLEKDKTNQ